MLMGVWGTEIQPKLCSKHQVWCRLCWQLKLRLSHRKYNLASHSSGSTFDWTLKLQWRSQLNQAGDKLGSRLRRSEEACCKLSKTSIMHSTLLLLHISRFLQFISSLFAGLETQPTCREYLAFWKLGVLRAALLECVVCATKHWLSCSVMSKTTQMLWRRRQSLRKKPKTLRLIIQIVRSGTLCLSP